MDIQKTFKGYIELFQFLFSSKKPNYLLSASLNTALMFVVVGLMGAVRTIMESHTPMRIHYFTLTPPIFTTMIFFPIFLCFFGTALMHFLSNKFGLKIKIKELLSVLFFMQIVHLIIPFFDAFASLCIINPHLDLRCMPSILKSAYIEKSRYLKLIFSPLAFTPFILFFTRDACISYVIAWAFAGLIFIKLYTKYFKFPVIKSLIVLSITFYVLYLSTYSSYYFFVKRISRDLYLYGLFFLLMSIPSIIYIEIQKKKEK